MFNIKRNKMKRILVLIFSLSVFYSCTKTHITPQNDDAIPSNEYYPMSVGNYWVYEFVNKLPDGSIVGSSTIDSIQIVKDTLIDEKLYYVFETDKPYANTRFTRRDSIGYIIDQHGEILLLPSADEALYKFHYGYIGNDTAYSYWEAYIDDISVQTSVGAYTCMGRLAYHEMWPNFGGNTTVDSNLYAPIGQLIRSYSYASGGKMYGSLINYAIEE
jgi:hypothetical protein